MSKKDGEGQLAQVFDALHKRGLLAESSNTSLSSVMNTLNKANWLTGVNGKKNFNVLVSTDELKVNNNISHSLRSSR